MVGLVRLQSVLLQALVSSLGRTVYEPTLSLRVSTQELTQGRVYRDRLER